MGYKIPREAPTDYTPSGTSSEARSRPKPSPQSILYEKPLAGVLSLIQNTHPSLSSVCLLGDFHDDVPMIEKRRVTIQKLEGMIDPSLSHRIILLEGVAALEPAQEHPLLERFLGKDLPLNMEHSTVLGCDHMDKWRESFELGASILEATEEVHSIQNQMKPLLKKDLDLIRQGLEAKLADLKEQIAQCWAKFHTLAKERSESMLETLAFCHQKCPQAFIYLVAGNDHLTHLTEGNQLSNLGILFSAVTFERDPDSKPRSLKEIRERMKL